MTRDEKIDKIYNALVSDEKMGHVGLIERVESLEKKAEEDKSLKQKVAGGIIVLSLVGSGVFFFLDWIVKTFWHK